MRASTTMDNYNEHSFNSATKCNNTMKLTNREGDHAGPPLRLHGLPPLA